MKAKSEGKLGSRVTLENTRECQWEDIPVVKVLDTGASTVPFGQNKKSQNAFLSRAATLHPPWNKPAMSCGSEPRGEALRHHSRWEREKIRSCPSSPPS